MDYDLSDLTVVELEKKLKKEGKAREKELKKLKAAQKAAATKHQKQQPAATSKSEMKKNAKKEAQKVNPWEVDPETPLGEKKKLSDQMAQNYNPSAVEKAWYEWWEKSNFFRADSKSSKPPFVIVLPPPNVTGALHIGHALTAAIQDTIIRWKRMSGYNTLWVPGMDHAGIATQVVVEKKLEREQNLDRHQIGRERFLDENEYGGQILKQLRRLGASLDWSRECFTMDEKRSRAVTEAFVRLHKEGLIYRDNRLVNWDCTLRTAISKSEMA
ncbi:Valine--tRNA ligase, mitochondrial 1 [Salvia divinorum]|uniref:valine--tRNA ligase n=1 Tax=Salvia divinorum TaxID=28513 RepID=A0ABD1IGN8_SALDI